MSTLPWQNAGHVNIRTMVKRRIINMLSVGHTSEEKRRHIEEVAEYLEQHLYNSATSVNRYSDWKTLRPRIQLLSMSPENPLLQALDLLRQMLLSRTADYPPSLAAAKQMWLHCSRCANPKCAVAHCNEVRHLLTHRCKCEGSCQMCDLIDY